MSARSRALIGLAAVLTAVYFVVPSGAAGEAIRVLAPSIAAGAVLVGIAGFRPSPTRPWVLIASAMGLLAGATLVWAVLFFRTGDPFPSASDALHLAAAASLCGGLSILSRQSTIDTDGPGGIEVAIVGIAIGLGVWLAVVEPYLADGDLAVADRVWALLAPLLGALAVALASRLAVQSQFRSPAPTLMLIGVTSLVVANVLRTVGELRGSHGPGGLVAAMIIPASLCIGAAALDPAMTTMNHDPEVGRVFGLGRVVWLSVAALTPLTVLLTLLLTGLGSRHDANARRDLFDRRRLAGPHQDVATRRHGATTDRASRAGPARRDGRTFERCGVADGRRRSRPVRQPGTGEHARAPIGRLDRAVDDRSGVGRRP